MEKIGIISPRSQDLNTENRIRRLVQRDVGRLCGGLGGKAVTERRREDILPASLDL